MGDSPALQHEESSGANRPLRAAPRRESAGGSWLRTGTELLLFLALALATTWPLAPSITTTLPLGTDTPTIPLFCLWTVWWNIDRIGQLGAGYWDAPLFHPSEGTLVYSEALLGESWMAAPVWWLTGSPILAYNLVVLASLTLNGWAGCRLLRAMHASWPAALAGGAFVEMAPLVHVKVGVLPLVPIFAIVWTIHGLYRFGRRPTIWRGVLLGGAFGLTYVLCGHYGLFLSLLLVVAGGFAVGRKLLQRRTWVGLLCGALAAGAIAGPLVLAQSRSAKQHEFKRSTWRVRGLSATPGNYARTPWKLNVPTPGTSTAKRPDHRAFFPGPIKVCLAILGSVVALASRRRRAFALFALTLGWSAWLLSQGARVRVGEWIPFEALAAVYPGFAQVRNIFRFAVFWQITVALMAGLGLDYLFRKLGTRRRRLPAALGRALRRPMVRAALILTIGAVGTVELFPARQKLYEPPSLERHAGWLRWMRENTPADAVVAQAPFPENGDVSNAVETAEFLWLQMVHRRTTVNGYSSFFPRTPITRSSSR